MSEPEEPIRARGRPSRTEEVTEERLSRRQPANSSTDAIYADWPKEAFDLNRFEYRGALDEGSRIFDLTVNDDYDIFGPNGKLPQDKRDSVDAAGVYRQRRGTRADGSPLWGYLLRKPKTFAEQHRAEKNAHLTEMEDAQKLRGGKDAPEKAYRPAEVRSPK